MKNNLPPLYYAIIEQFKDGNEYCAADIMAALEKDYASYKLFNIKDVEESLATAKENGILEEVRADFNTDKELCIFYQMTDFGKDMVEQYL